MRDIKKGETEKMEVEQLRETLNGQLQVIEQKNEELEKLHRQQV